MTPYDDSAAQPAALELAASSVPPPASAPPPAPAAGRYAPMTPWSPLWGLGASVLVMAIVFGLLAMGAGAVSVFNPGAFLRIGSKVQMHFERPAVAYGFAAVMLVSQLFGVGLTVWFARMYGGRPVEVLALRRPYAGHQRLPGHLQRPPRTGLSTYLPAVRSGAVAYFWAVPAFVVFGFSVGALVQYLSPQSNQADTENMLLLTHAPAWWLIFIAAAVFAPLQEELMFRGFLFSALARSRLGVIGAAIITSIGWAVIHGYSLAGDATIFALGLALSFILWRTGSTRVTMLCHGSYNALAFLAALSAPPSGI